MATHIQRAMTNKDMILYAKLDKHSQKFRHIAADLAIMLEGGRSVHQEVNKLMADLKRLATIPIHELNKSLGDLEIDTAAVALRFNAPALLGPNVDREKPAEFMSKYMEMTSAAIDLYMKAEELAATNV